MYLAIRSLANVINSLLLWLIVSPLYATNILVVNDFDLGLLETTGSWIQGSVRIYGDGNYIIHPGANFTLVDNIATPASIQIIPSGTEVTLSCSVTQSSGATFQLIALENNNTGKQFPCNQEVTLTNLVPNQPTIFNLHLDIVFDALIYDFNLDSNTIHITLVPSPEPLVTPEAVVPIPLLLRQNPSILQRFPTGFFLLLNLLPNNGTKRITHL